MGQRRDLITSAIVLGLVGALVGGPGLVAEPPAPAPAQTSAPVQTQAPKPCDSEQHRQFDFWVGDWEVSQPDGKVVGSNRIEKILDGCVIKENWVGGSMRGESYNISTASGWHQTWVDTTGRLLTLDGELQNGKMVLAGQTQGQDGKPIQHEIAWTPMEDGRVKQHWRTSRDAGKTWSDAFVGLYARKK